MKTLLKKAVPFIVILCLLMSMLTVSVSAAGSSVAFSKNKLAIGETLTVTARFSTSSSDPISGLVGYLTYDPAVLDFVSASGNVSELTPGKLKIVIVLQSPKTNLEENVKFKAIKSGSSLVSLENLVYVDSAETEQQLSGSSATVTVTNPSAQASSDANLKGLVVSAGALSPKFSPDVTSYTVTIENSVTELYVSCSKSDSAATYTVKGSKDMKVGKNQRSIVVTAENGNTKTYTITITRLDENGNVPTEETDKPLNEITEVTVDGDIFHVQEDFSAQTLPSGFNVMDYAFDGKTIPALGDGTYIMIFLSLPDGSASDFYIVNSDNKFTKLISIDLNGVIYSILPASEIPEGYTLVNDCQINGVTVPAYKSAKGPEDFFMVYAKGPGGQNGFYNYDTVDNTLQRALNLTLNGGANENDPADKPVNADGNVLDAFMQLGLNAKIVVITILAIILLLIMAIIVLIVKIARAGKAKKEMIAQEGEDLDFEYISIGEPITNTDAEETMEDQTVSEENSEESTEEESAQAEEEATDETETDE